jgi:NAD-dependent deacetylase
MPDLERVAERLRAARRVAALTGAGVSAASGVPTFRGTDGLWKKVRAETLATPEAFEHDPKFVWEWYDWRRQMIKSVAPNAAHDVLARWTLERPGFTLITQNVDGLHERASEELARRQGLDGSGSAQLLRLHGSIWHVRCWNACARGRQDWLDDVVPQPSLPPRCPHCGGLVRPGVVWFGEPLDPEIVDAAQRAASTADVFLSIGTSSVVYPAAGLVHQAKRQGSFTVEINTDTTDATGVVDVALRGPAAEILIDLARRVAE